MSNTKNYQTGSPKGVVLRNVMGFVIFQWLQAMDQDSHCTAERELLEAVSRITTSSTTSPSDEEENQPEAEISCQVRKENPEKDDTQGWHYPLSFI